MIARPSRSSITASSQRAVGSVFHQAAQRRGVGDLFEAARAAQPDRRRDRGDQGDHHHSLVGPHTELDGHSVSTSSQENLAKLAQLSAALERKIDLSGTKAQLKPTWSKVQSLQQLAVFLMNGAINVDDDLAIPIGLPGEGPPGSRNDRRKRLEKLPLVFKRGGKFTHAARINPGILARTFGRYLYSGHAEQRSALYFFQTSRVTASAEIFDAAVLDNSTPRNISHINPDSALYRLIIRTDLLDNSNAAKDLMGGDEKFL
ncbi:hypothetical protein FS837_005297, partial [Tulasnella sp. UAMH 9824]